MKTILAILASASLFTVTASAHDRYESRSRIVGHTECGTPIFAFLEVVGRSRCGDPILEWVTHYPRESDHRDWDRRDHDRDHDFRHHEELRHHHDER